MDSVWGTLLHGTSGHVAQQIPEMLRQLCPGGWERERGGGWKAFSAVACDWFWKKCYPKPSASLFKFFSPLQGTAAVRFICWAGCTLPCGVLDRVAGTET